MPLRHIALIIDDIRSTYNVGSIFRTADCFGITHIYISGYTPYPKLVNDKRLPHIAQKLHNQIAKASLGAEAEVPFSIHTSVKSAIYQAKKDGYDIIALEQDMSSIPITDYEPKNPIAIILGNEVSGIPDWTKSQCSEILEIKQYGSKESLNVASAAAIAMFALKSKN